MATIDSSWDYSSYIDLRSDTVTLPSDEMRRAMASAAVGDDFYGEDPTVNLLEERAAATFGREAALFVPTGTMGNQIAIKLHTKPGSEILCEELGHVYRLELAMIAWFSGCQVRPIHTGDGKLKWSMLKDHLQGPAYCRAHTGLISMENTHNLASGAVTPIADMREICAEAHKNGIPVHLDGARVFNAALALGAPVAEVTKGFDTVMFCLSKGLGAPVGSMLVGQADLIEEARTIRKALGGGMRQAGVLAAAGLIALEKGPKRLQEDHDNARYLAEELANMPGCIVDTNRVETNIFFVDIVGTGMNSTELSAKLKERGVLINGMTPSSLRVVTHLGVTREHCKKALEVFAEVVKK